MRWRKNFVTSYRWDDVKTLEKRIHVLLPKYRDDDTECFWHNILYFVRILYINDNDVYTNNRKCDSAIHLYGSTADMRRLPRHSRLFSSQRRQEFWTGQLTISNFRWTTAHLRERNWTNDLEKGSMTRTFLFRWPKFLHFFFSTIFSLPVAHAQNSSAEVW